ncbi:MAG TPA: hypothetical protein VHQ92_15810 [Pseudolabrys sp.]|jgi:uncharacterized membrane protein|nr:hypothetical protein [Pseudolabrys sp.]
MFRAVAVLTFLATALPARAAGISDVEALAIVQKHCVMCHAVAPSHESFREAPKNIILESIADIRKHAATVYTQTVQTKAMPLGNQTAMTDDERSALGRWLKE